MCSRPAEYIRLLLITMVFGLLSPVWAGEVLRNEVYHQDRSYSLEFEAIIESNFDDVYGLLTDYRNLHHLSDAVIESEVLEAEGDRVRLRFLTRTCILLFCFKKILVADVVEPVKGQFEADDIAELSDFEKGEGTWQLSPHGHQTNIHFVGEVKPDFWIPPVIGPFLIEQKMKNISSESIKQVEDRLKL